MGKLDCVEPAYVQGSRQFVQHARAGDQLYFPHVDSCMAIVWILDDGSAVGGHVPVVWSQARTTSTIRGTRTGSACR